MHLFEELSWYQTLSKTSLGPKELASTQTEIEKSYPLCQKFSSLSKLILTYSVLSLFYNQHLKTPTAELSQEVKFANVDLWIELAALQSAFHDLLEESRLEPGTQEAQLQAIELTVKSLKERLLAYVVSHSKPSQTSSILGIFATI